MIEYWSETSRDLSIRPQSLEDHSKCGISERLERKPGSGQAVLRD